MKYCSVITRWGNEAMQFLNNEDLQCIIIFNEGAPEELADMAILHEPAPILKEIEVGDIIELCGKHLKISAIGEEAMETLRDLGHCTLSFKGGSKPERPGCIMLEGKPVVPGDFYIGGYIKIY